MLSEYVSHRLDRISVKRACWPLKTSITPLQIFSTNRGVWSLVSFIRREELPIVATGITWGPSIFTAYFWAVKMPYTSVRNLRLYCYCTNLEERWLLRMPLLHHNRKPQVLLTFSYNGGKRTRSSSLTSLYRLKSEKYTLSYKHWGHPDEAYFWPFVFTSPVLLQLCFELWYCSSEKTNGLKKNLHTWFRKIFEHFLRTQKLLSMLGAVQLEIHHIRRYHRRLHYY